MSYKLRKLINRTETESNNLLLQEREKTPKFDKPLWSPHPPSPLHLTATGGAHQTGSQGQEARPDSATSACLHDPERLTQLLPLPNSETSGQPQTGCRASGYRPTRATVRWGSPDKVSTKVIGRSEAVLNLTLGSYPDSLKC